MPDIFSSLASEANPISAGVGIVQAGIGIAQTITGNARLKRLMQQRTPYRTPDEYYNLENIAMNSAQTGFDASTQQTLNTENDRALSSSFGALTRLGGDPNSVASIFNNSVMNIMQNAKQDEALKLAKFTKVYDTVLGVARQKDAEWADKEAILKDQMAAAGQKVAAGNKNLQSGLNMSLGALANEQASNLYKDRTAAISADSPFITREIPGAVVTRVPDPSLAPMNPYGMTGPVIPDWLSAYSGLGNYPNGIRYN